MNATGTLIISNQLLKSGDSWQKSVIGEYVMARKRHLYQIVGRGSPFAWLWLGDLHDIVEHPRRNRVFSVTY